MARSPPRGTRPVWRPFNSTTHRECSIIPFICCTESVCATKGVYLMPNNFRLACIFFYHLRCNSSNMSGKLRAVHVLPAAQRSAFTSWGDWATCLVWKELELQEGLEWMLYLYDLVVACRTRCVYIYIFIFYFGSLNRDLFCCCKCVLNMQRLNNPQHWRFNEALFTMYRDISFGKEVSWNGNYLVLGRFTMWPRAEMRLRKDMCKYKRPCSEHQMSQCRMQM